VVKEDVPENTVVAYLEEHNEDFPGIEVQKTFLREYTYANGAMLSHILGYVGETSDHDLDQPEFAELTGNTHVGKDGVERQYDAYLRGEDGLRQVEVSASGKPVRVINDAPADTGYNLILTIDSELQDATEAALVEGIRMAHGQGYGNAAAGAVVAMDPRNGEILAMASYPDYDPEKWVGGISQADYAAYNSEEANNPLFNRALSGLYPAGSTFKPFVASVAMDAGIVSWDHSILCKGRYRVEYQVGKEKDYQIWKDWTYPYAHGETNLVQAIPRSCDIFFYTLGYTLYQQDSPVFQNGIRRFGFGRTTGVDLPGETGRSVVPDKIWAREQGTQWKTGDEINLSIGQGDLAATPLQLAVALSALVNGGTVWVPHVALEIRDSSNRVISTLEPDERSQLNMDQDILEKVKWGMRLVCQSREGTAWEAWHKFPVDVGGKTGTAEVKRGSEQLDDYSLFIGYAPANEEVLPEIVVAAIVEQGGHGSTVAAPIVRRVLEAYYDLPNYWFYFKEFSE
jgi:penicillin-binding protein 2